MRIKDEDLIDLGFRQYTTCGTWWIESPSMSITFMVFDQMSGELHIEDEVNGMSEDTLLSIVNSKEELEQVLETLLI